MICTDVFYKKNSFPITIKKPPMLQMTKKRQRDREGEDALELSLKGCYISSISEQNHPDDQVIRVVCSVNEKCNLYVHTCVHTLRWWEVTSNISLQS